jgi:hypothetical protein
MARLIQIDASAMGSRRLIRKRLPPYGYRASRLEASCTAA